MPEQTEEEVTSRSESGGHADTTPARTTESASWNTHPQGAGSSAVESPAAGPSASSGRSADHDQTGPVGVRNASYSQAGINESVAALNALDELPLGEHVERFEAVHAQLTAALSSIDKV